MTGDTEPQLLGGTTVEAPRPDLADTTIENSDGAGFDRAGVETLEPDEMVPGEPSEVRRPIFIVGCHRSGTSMLRQLLDSHPRISCGPEDISLYYLSQLDNDLWRMTLQGYGFTEAEWNSKTRELFEGLHWRYANSQRKNRWAVKCPEHCLIIGYLDKLYPDCQVVHIVRHPRDVIASNYRKYGPRKGAFYGGRWVNLVRSAESSGAQLGPQRFRTIKYENLVADPERELKDLVSWLGEPWSPEILRYGERTHTYPPRLKPKQNQGKIVVHTRSIGKGRSRDFVQPLLYVRLHANDLLKRFGYKVSLFDDRK